MSSEVGGPVPTIKFQDGTTLPYERPTNTCDPRHAACTEHHPACDCREAELREEINELRSHLRMIDEAAEQVLAGHPCLQFYRDPRIGRDDGEEEQAHCMCTGCQIVRRGHILAAHKVSEARNRSAREWSRRERGI